MEKILDKKDPHSTERQLFQLQKRGFEEINKNLEKIKENDVTIDIKGAELVTYKGEKGEPGNVFADLTAKQKLEIKGDNGHDGKDGVDGNDGRDGDDGEDGINGSDGTPGPRGFSGKDGLNGKDGVDGRDGVDGVDGKNGMDGKSVSQEEISNIYKTLKEGTAGNRNLVGGGTNSLGKLIDVDLSGLTQDSAGNYILGAGTSYTLPTASASVLGGVKVGAGLTITGDTLSADTQAGVVSSVSVVTANGISGSVATATTTPAITLTLGAITPTSTNGVSSATMAFLDATSSVQTQLNGKQASLGFTAENTANKSTNVTTDGASDTKYPSVKAVKDYVDPLVAGLLDYRGAYDASVNTFPASGGSGTAGAVLKGDMWIFSVAGTLGGVAVQIGDSVIANVDTPGQTAGNWNILNSNISYVPEDVANKATTMSGNTASDTKYLSAKAVYDWGVATFAALAGSISQAFSVASLDLGNADTSLTRVSAGVIAVEGVTVPTVSSTNTFTNKRVTKRTGTTTSHATPTINTDNVDFYSLTAQAEAITSMTTNLSGTPTENQTLWIAITGTAARAITWGTSFEASTVALPTTTVTTARLDVGFVWNTVTSKWRCVASV